MRTKEGWLRVSPGSPCSVCAKADYCTRSTDGKVAKCMRIASPRPVASGGWIHDSEVAPIAAPVRSVRRLADVGKLAGKMFRDRLAFGKRLDLAKTLGVAAVTLHQLGMGIGWDRDGTEFASFPSRDEHGKVVGITRRYADGSKKTLAGTSNSGIFAPVKWWEWPGPVLIVEGASDVAALLTSGFAALGRPSNIGGWKVIAAYLKRRAKGRRVIVLGENDRKPSRVGSVPQCPIGCDGCNWCWPGRYGAKETARRLGCWYMMLPNGWKDVRAWANGSSDFRAKFLAFLGS